MPSLIHLIRLHRSCLSLRASLLLMGLTPAAAYGADILPVGSQDASELARTASPMGVEKGGLVIRTTTETLNFVDVTKGSEAPASRISRIDRTQLLVGLGLSRRISLSLGMRATKEDMPRDQRLSLFPDQASANRFATTDRLPSGLEFAAATLAVKIGLLDQRETDGLSLAVMPFMESGSGEKSTYAVSRSVEPKGGAALLAAIGSVTSGELATQVGVRSRRAETIAGHALGYETFYKLRATLPLSDIFGLFGEAEGRALMLRPSSGQEPGQAQAYKLTYGGDGRVGMTVRADVLALSVFGGRRLGPVTGLGFASQSFGASLSWAIGKAARIYRPHSYATEIEREEERKAKLLKSVARPIKPASLEQEHELEMIGTEIDPLEALGPDGAPDFKDVKRRMAEEQKNAAADAEEARIQREMDELKAAEARSEAEATKRKAKDAEAARRDALEEAQEEAKNFQKWVDDAHQDLNSVEGIAPEDLRWHGLEDSSVDPQ